MIHFVIYLPIIYFLDNIICQLFIQTLCYDLCQKRKNTCEYKKNNNNNRNHSFKLSKFNIRKNSQHCLSFIFIGPKNFHHEPAMGLKLERAYLIKAIRD